MVLTMGLFSNYNRRERTKKPIHKKVVYYMREAPLHHAHKMAHNSEPQTPPPDYRGLSYFERVKAKARYKEEQRQQRKIEKYDTAAEVAHKKIKEFGERRKPIQNTGNYLVPNFGKRRKEYERY